MSIGPDPTPPPGPPPGPPPRQPPRPRGGSGVLLGFSLALNLAVLGFCVLSLFLFAFLRSLFGGSAEETLTERFHSGKSSATDKIAIIRISGVLLDGTMGYANKQIDRAAQDAQVKAVVLRINSPGGSITAADDLHHRLMGLRDGKDGKPGKPIIVSMGALAASGGYYIAMPGQSLYAERTTITGSIGVYASFPNFTDLGDKVGFEMYIIKAGRIKDSGSPFQHLTPEERYVWQQMVNHAYEQFKEVVEAGRPQLKGKLEDKVIDEPVTYHFRDRVRENAKDVEKVEKEVEKQIRYVRQLADGGIWTADQALHYKLIDHIGYLDDAVKDAAQVAGLGEKYRAVEYDKPFSLTDALTGAKAPEPAMRLDLSKLGEAATPRLWYLAPQSDLAGLLRAVGSGSE